MRVEMEKIVSLCKRRGFIFQNSEIYGGLGSAWDYGPLGVELKNNIKRLWWRDNVRLRDDVVGLDSAISMHPTVWKASGHLDSFSDPFVGCLSCGRHYRLDQTDDLATCPRCGGNLSDPKPANLMVEILLGPVRETAIKTYLRPETAQGIFVNFDNVLTTSRKKLPFGIAQIGKAFRNEITPGNFIFRTREFEQMEIEYFVRPGTDEEWHQKWIDERFAWYHRYGIRKENIRFREHTSEELAHYAKRCVDIEYLFPMGWSELEGIANRTDYDLRRHSEFSGRALEFYDAETKEHVVPYVVEPSAGTDRSTLAFLVDAYHEEKVREEKRVVLKLHKELAPIQIAVLPLLRNRSEIVEMARKIEGDLRRYYASSYDDTASIGRLYRRQDEIGTPFCVTVDVQSLKDQAVTVRDRDTMEQDRIHTDKLLAYFHDYLNNPS